MPLSVKSDHLCVRHCSTQFYIFTKTERERERRARGEEEMKCLSRLLYFPLPSLSSRVKAVMTWPSKYFKRREWRGKVKIKWKKNLDFITRMSLQ